MKTPDDIIRDETDGEFPPRMFNFLHVIDLMEKHAKQFAWIKTTCGKLIEFDLQDYDLLRNQAIFLDNSRGYLMICINSKNGKKTMSPVGKILLNGKGKSIVHYKDGNFLNIKRGNIELITHRLAHQKQQKSKTSNGVLPTSIYKGVSFNKFANKWSASIKVNFKKKHLGYFLTEEEAAKSYNEAAIKNWGKEYSNLNVINSK
jgi:hypothetical protein